MDIESKCGILGGGQLSMMLLQKAHSLGLSPQHLSTSSQDPAFQVSPKGILGDPRNPEDLKKFTQNLNYLTFESEFFDAAYLKKELTHFKGTIFPSLDCLQLLQDRKTQKESFNSHKLLTSPHLHSKNPEPILGFMNQMKGLVAKKRWNGYDGYGTTVLKTSKDLQNFLDQNTSQLDQFIFEKKINFDYEVALQVARSRAGHVVFLPLVKTTQKDNKCFLVEGPEKNSLQLISLQRKIKKYLDAINYVGVIGFEFFKVKNDFILNEVAPRVHNTGHHTLDSCEPNQFTLHWLCALQDRLPKIHLKSKSFVMLNLIGNSDKPVIPPDQSEGVLYWYGKSNRVGRKLGHINFTGENKKALVTRALKELKRWKL